MPHMDGVVMSSLHGSSQTDLFSFSVLYPTLFRHFRPFCRFVQSATITGGPLRHTPNR